MSYTKTDTCMYCGEPIFLKSFGAHGDLWRHYAGSVNGRDWCQRTKATPASGVVL